MSLKFSPLHEYHLEYGVKLAPLAGWSLPLHFENGIAAECRETVCGASLFDLCGSGKFRLTGKMLAEAMKTNFYPDPTLLAVGGTGRFLRLDAKGNAVETVRLLHMAENDYLLLASPAPTVPQIAGVEVQDLTGVFAELYLSGPKAAGLLASLGAEQLPMAENWEKLSVDQLPAILFYDDVTGVPGWQLLFNAEAADQLWDLLLDEGALPAGYGALESFRIAAGLPGTPDLDGRCQPEKLDLVLLHLEKNHVPLPGTPVTANGSVIGQITSAAADAIHGGANAIMRGSFAENQTVETTTGNLTVSGKPIRKIEVK